MHIYIWSPLFFDQNKLSFNLWHFKEPKHLYVLFLHALTLDVDALSQPMHNASAAARETHRICQNQNYVCLQM